MGHPHPIHPLRLVRGRVRGGLGGCGGPPRDRGSTVPAPFERGSLARKGHQVHILEIGGSSPSSAMEAVRGPRCSEARSGQSTQGWAVWIVPELTGVGWALRGSTPRRPLSAGRKERPGLPRRLLTADFEGSNPSRPSRAGSSAARANRGEGQGKRVAPAVVLVTADGVCRRFKSFPALFSAMPCPVCQEPFANRRTVLNTESIDTHEFANVCVQATGDSFASVYTHR